mgnify:FL=1
MANFPASVIELAKRKASELESFETTAALAAKRHKSKEQEEAEQLVDSFLEQFQQIPLATLAPQEAITRVQQLKQQLLDSSDNPIVRSLLPTALKHQ